MLSFVPVSAHRILDVGCGIGVFGEELKRRRCTVVEGVEIVPEKAAEARTRLDTVWEGCYGSSMPLPAGIYDTIVFNDVLEHMSDPTAALAWSLKLLAREGCVVASIPNIRHFPTVWKLAVQGQWNYTDQGILDRTHLRFFTRATIGKLFSEAGYRVIEIRGINRFGVSSQDEHRLWRYFKVLSALVPGKLRDMSYLQFAVVAVPQSRCSVP